MALKRITFILTLSSLLLLGGCWKSKRLCFDKDGQPKPCFSTTSP